MTQPAPEFSRLVPLERLGAAPFRQEIAATEAERAALARRFGLASVARLTAIVGLVRQEHGMIRLQASFEAAFIQDCVVTLEPVADALSAAFSLCYGPPEAELLIDGGAEADEAFEPLAGDCIDIGEAVAQEFSLALPPFPRHPDAAIEPEPAAPSSLASPFAALSDRRS